MRILKYHPLLKAITNFLVDAPQASNLSYWWNVGSLLGLSLGIQIITGVTLAMHYNPSVIEAFNSVEHVMRDVNNGWLIRYLHSNTASAFFFLVYLHIGKGLYYGSYKGPRTLVWTIGTTILLLMMATAFLGFLHSPKWHKHNNNKKKINGRRYYITNTKNNYSETVSQFLLDKNLSPIISFENLQTRQTKDEINSYSKDKSGIYLILNKITLDYFVGSASNGKIYSRFYRHLISFNGSKIVKNAVKKYKLDNFAFIVLEIFPEQVNKENNKKLLDLEDFYLKSLLPNYNILTEAGNTFGYKHTDIDRIKMITNYSEQRRMIIGDINRGKPLSEEVKNKLREKALSRPNRIFSKEALNNMKKKSRAVIFYNKDNTVYGEYSSIKKASVNISCSEKTIMRALKSKSKLLKRRLIVKYK